jgi:hypothetical protein
MPCWIRTKTCDYVPAARECEIKSRTEGKTSPLVPKGFRRIDWKQIPLAIDTLVELTKDNHTDSTRYSAATALLDRGYGRSAQSLDLHLSADAITKRLSDMTDAELAALEARMIAAAPIVLEATADVSDDAGDVENSPPDAPA